MHTNDEGQRREHHKMLECTVFKEGPADALLARLSEAYGLLSILELAAEEGASEFQLVNSRIVGAGLRGIQHLVAEAHYAATRIYPAA